MNVRKSVAALSIAALGAFSVAVFSANEKKDVKAIEAAASGSWRSNDEKARDVYRHPVVQQGVGRVPVIVAEIPAGVLAQQDDKPRPEQEPQTKERIFAGR